MIRLHSLWRFNVGRWGGSVLKHPLSVSIPRGRGSGQTNDEISDFGAFGLLQPLVDGVYAQGLKTPTLIQSSVIPRLLSSNDKQGENMVFSASTGSGKTLAYALPLINNLLVEEKLGYKRFHRLPRCLILVPTRELATQVLEEIKILSHFARVSSCSILGGESYNIQKKRLSGKVDIVIASPGRLVQHEKMKHVDFGEVNCIVIDEVDTMLTQGFGTDVRYVLQKIYQAGKGVGQGKNRASPRIPQLIMASATMTKAVKSLLHDVDGFNTNFSDLTSDNLLEGNRSTRRIASVNVPINIVEVEGVHRPLSHVTHRMVDIKGSDKMIVLDDVIQEMKGSVKKTMIFCNTIDSCRAVAFYIESQIPCGLSLSYHGEVNSRDRQKNMEIFRGDASIQPLYMVCTDIGARGLDIPGVDHVIMFDFPMNSIDYLHRAGRTGRLGKAGKNRGLVTSLVAKRDLVLAMAIEGAIDRNMPIDSLTSDKKDYRDKGKLAGIVGRRDIKDYEKNKGPRITLKRRSNKRLVSDPKAVGIYVQQPARKILSRTVAKRIAELNQKRGETMLKRRKKAAK